MTQSNYQPKGSQVFRLRDLKNGLFQFHVKRGQAWEGTPRSICQKALESGVNENDLAHALQKLTDQGFDYADFTQTGRYDGVFFNPTRK
jgi:hypothetical protein